MNNQTVFIIIITLYLCFVLRNINLFSPFSFILPLGENPSRVNARALKKTEAELLKEKKSSEAVLNEMKNLQEKAVVKIEQEHNRVEQQIAHMEQEQHRIEQQLSQMEQEQQHYSPEKHRAEQQLAEIEQEKKQLKAEQQKLKEHVIIKRGDKTVADCPINEPFLNTDNALGLVGVPVNQLVPDFEPSAYNLQSPTNDFGYATINKNDNEYLVRRSAIFPNNGLGFAQNIANNLDTR
jgi:DNA polymerase III alpha subunit (gram-positive type)